MPAGPSDQTLDRTREIMHFAACDRQQHVPVRMSPFAPTVLGKPNHHDAGRESVE